MKKKNGSKYNTVEDDIDDYEVKKAKASSTYVIVSC